MNPDTYFSLPEVSNSDLSWLKKYWMLPEVAIDFEKAYKFGTLVDAMLTEPHRVNYYKFTVDGVQYEKKDFETAELMKKAYRADLFCSKLHTQSSFQKISRGIIDIEHDGFKFSLQARCKWDLFIEAAGWGADIKSTAATSQKQFEEACRYFDYDRQRAWYMDIVKSKYDMLIGISKVNYKVFKIPITRDSDFFKSGQQKYKELAFKWWYLFEDLRIMSGLQENRVYDGEAVHAQA